MTKLYMGIAAAGGFTSAMCACASIVAANWPLFWVMVVSGAIGVAAGAMGVTGE